MKLTVRLFGRSYLTTTGVAVLAMATLALGGAFALWLAWLGLK